MAKQARQSSTPKRSSKKKDTRQPDAVVVDFPQRHSQETPLRTKLEGRTPNQKTYLNAMRHQLITVGLGPAAAGKTFLSASQAAKDFQERKYSRIIVTRPAVNAGEDYGFLPGGENDKLAPYFEPVREVLEEWLGVAHVEYLVKRKLIRFVPMGHLRGRTFKDAVVLLDESQNTTPEQMRLFLTRIGENCRIVINGDLTQKDIQNESGLADIVKRFEGMEEFTFVHFSTKDCQRHPVVAKIMERYGQT